METTKTIVIDLCDDDDSDLNFDSTSSGRAALTDDRLYGQRGGDGNRNECAYIDLVGTDPPSPTVTGVAEHRGSPFGVPFPLSSSNNGRKDRDGTAVPFQRPSVEQEKVYNLEDSDDDSVLSTSAFICGDSTSTSSNNKNNKTVHPQNARTIGSYSSCPITCFNESNPSGNKAMKRSLTLPSTEQQQRQPQRRREGGLQHHATKERSLSREKHTLLNTLSNDPFQSNATSSVVSATKVALESKRSFETIGQSNEVTTTTTKTKIKTKTITKIKTKTKTKTTATTTTTKTTQVQIPHYTKPYTLSPNSPHHHPDNSTGTIYPPNNPSSPYYHRIVLIIDSNELRYSRSNTNSMNVGGPQRVVQMVQAAGLHAEIGLSTVVSSSSPDGRRKNLPIGDYLMVVRKLDRLTHQPVYTGGGGTDDEDVLLEFVVERKHVIDLVGSIIPKGPYRPLSRMESQMRRMRYCGLSPRPILLIEGNEDTYGQSRGMTDTRRKAVKTFRESMRAGKCGAEFRLVETKDLSGTVGYLIGEMRRATERWRAGVMGCSTGDGGGVAEVGIFSNLVTRADAIMKDQTFRYYLGLMNLPGVGEKRAFTVMKRCTTVEALARICENEDCVEVMEGWKTHEGMGGIKLGRNAAEAVRDWCVKHWMCVQAFPHVPYALPFVSPSIAKTRSLVMIHPL